MRSILIVIAILLLMVMPAMATEQPDTTAAPDTTTIAAPNQDGSWTVYDTLRVAEVLSTLDQDRRQAWAQIRILSEALDIALTLIPAEKQIALQLLTQKRGQR